MKNSIIALNLSVQLGLEGRDALIIANFLANKIPTMYTHDRELVKLEKISWKNSHLTLENPLIK